MHVKPLKNYKAYVIRQNHRSHSNASNNSFLKNVDIKSYTNDYNFLDIGCRNPVVLSKLYDMGFKNVYGMDIGENATLHWKSLPFIDNLKKCDVHDGIPFDLTFNVIMMSHVLEHLFDPVLCVKLIKDKLVQNGYVYCVVPFETKESIHIDDTDDHPNPHYVAFINNNDHKNFWIENGFIVLNDFSNVTESRLLLQKI